MKVCRRVPTAVNGGGNDRISKHSYCCVDDNSVLMRIDMNQSVLSDKAEWLVFTEAY